MQKIDWDSHKHKKFFQSTGPAFVLFAIMIFVEKYSRQIGYSSAVVAIFLFMPLVHTALFAGFVAIAEPGKLPFSDYLLMIGETFLFRYYFNMPAIALLVLAVIVFRKNKH